MMSARVDSISANIVTDFECPTDGVTNCDTAIAAFNTWAQAQEALGETCIDLHFPTGGGTYITGLTHQFSGIRRLRVFFNGATIKSNSEDPEFATLILGAGQEVIPFIEEAQVYNAPIVTVYPGSRTVQLVTAAQHDKFTVGQWGILSAVDIMGFGWPFNPGIHEYVKITAINTGTGLITLSTPIVNEYRSTYPQYSIPEQLDQGGPAMLWALAPEWDCEHDYYDLALASTQGHTYSTGRIIRFHRPVMSGVTYSPLPTMNMLYSVRGGNFGEFTETDKIVDRISLRDTAMTQTLVQSSSINVLELENFTGSLNGTPKRLWVRDSNLPSLTLGAAGYGVTSEADVADSVVSALSHNTSSAVPISELTIASGVISRDFGEGPIPWAIPGTHVLFGGGSLGNRTGFNVVDVRKDGAFTEVDTDLVGGWPDIAGIAEELMTLFAHPCPLVRFQNVTGSDAAVDHSQAGAQDLPLYSYSKRTYTGNTFPTGLTGPINWGVLVSITVTVSQVYTGAQGTLTLNLLGQFITNALGVDRSAVVGSSWVPVVNLKTAGTRTITPGSVTGAQAGDTLSAPGAIWFMGQGTPHVSATISGEASNLWPIVEIEIISDQGIAA